MVQVNYSDTLQACRGAVSVKEHVPLRTAGSSCAPDSFVRLAGTLYPQTIEPYRAKYRAVERQPFSTDLVVEIRKAFWKPAARAFSS